MVLGEKRLERDDVVWRISRTSLEKSSLWTDHVTSGFSATNGQVPS